ncbi:hypothetical protein HAX54_013916, partial [Datura stramonium]|nr:hypothetical protein [Datura stramonium]
LLVPCYIPGPRSDHDKKVGPESISSHPTRSKEGNEGCFDSFNKLCSRVDVVERVASTLRADVRELIKRTPMTNPDMTFLDDAMAAPHIVHSPIDDLLASLGEDNEAEHGDDGGKAAATNDDVDDE